MIIDNSTVKESTCVGFNLNDDINKKIETLIKKYGVKYKSTMIRNLVNYGLEEIKNNKEIKIKQNKTSYVPVKLTDDSLLKIEEYQKKYKFKNRTDTLTFILEKAIDKINKTDKIK